jgi:hypothetical protein
MLYRTLTGKSPTSKVPRMETNPYDWKLELVHIPCTENGRPSVRFDTRLLCAVHEPTGHTVLLRFHETGCLASAEAKQPDVPLELFHQATEIFAEDLKERA